MAHDIGIDGSCETEILRALEETVLYKDIFPKMYKKIANCGGALLYKMLFQDMLNSEFCRRHFTFSLPPWGLSLFQASAKA